jgi:hypothetical protein
MSAMKRMAFIGADSALLLKALDREREQQQACENRDSEDQIEE